MISFLFFFILETKYLLWKKKNLQVRSIQNCLHIRYVFNNSFTTIDVFTTSLWSSYNDRISLPNLSNLNRYTALPNLSSNAFQRSSSINSLRYPESPRLYRKETPFTLNFRPNAHARLKYRNRQKGASEFIFLQEKDLIAKNWVSWKSFLPSNRCLRCFFGCKDKYTVMEPRTEALGGNKILAN